MKAYGFWSSEINKTENEAELESKSLEIATNFILNHPIEVIKLWPKKIWYLWYKDVDGIAWNMEAFPKMNSLQSLSLQIFKVFSQSWYVIFLLLFLVSIFVLHYFTKSKIIFMGLFVAIYFTIITLIFFGSSRFHFAVIPYLSINVGMIIEFLIRKNNHKNLELNIL